MTIMPTRITPPARAALVAAAALLAGQAAAQATPPREPSPPVVMAAPRPPPMITNGPMPPPGPPLPLAARPVFSPRWIDKPTGAEYAAFYPKAAARAGVPGRATIRCVVRRDGRLADCAIISEDPVGMGFGDATLRVALKFRMGPTDGKGDPVVGRRVVLPLKFRLVGDTPPAPPQPPS
jgi:protein TonB